MTRERENRRTITAVVAVVAASLLLGSTPAQAGDREPSLDECIAASDQGQVLRDQSEYLEARGAFRTCSRTGCPNVVQSGCTRWLAEIEAGLPTVVFAVRDETNVVDDVAVEVDGAPWLERLTGTAMPVDPGRHVFTFRRGGSVARVEALINVGEKNRLVVARFERPPAPASAAPPAPARDVAPSTASPAFPIALAAVGVTGVFAFAFLGASALSDLHALERAPCATTGTCTHDDVHSVRTRFLVGDIALVAGVAALAGAAVVWWLSYRVSARVSATPAGAAVGAAYRF